MIELLPKSLEVDGRNYEINSDFRVALLIFQAYNDDDLNDFEKCRVCVECLYKEIPENYQKALDKATWFLDGGDIPQGKQLPVRVLDWEQDGHIIFPALNKVAGVETRTVDYMHWWTFLGLFNEVGDGLFTQVISIRTKKAKHKKLDKIERDFYSEHKELIDLKPKLTAEDKEELDFINSLV